MAWVVAKYGGTSVATAANWGVIVGRARELVETEKARCWIVVSALSGVTNALLSSLDDALAKDKRFERYNWIVAQHRNIARDMELTDEEFSPVEQLLDELKSLLSGIILTQEAGPRLKARVAAYGELLSSEVGVAFLRKQGFPDAVRVDSRTLLTSYVPEADVRAESDLYLEADVRPSIQVDKGNAAAQGARVVISQGFIASTPQGFTCLLGRGGSDTSGALFAALLNAKRCEVWTDVSGLFSADPRFLPASRLIRSVSYREAQELAALGAKVLHPRAIGPVAFAGIPLEIRNTMDPAPDAELTVITETGLDFLTMKGATSGPSPSSPSLSAAAVAASAGAPLPSGMIRASNSYGQLAGLATTTSSGAGAMPSCPSSPSDGGVAAPAKAKVLAVARRKGITLINISSFGMWGSAGFLSRVFQPFGTFGVSVDLIATSQYAVTVTVDHVPEGTSGEPFRKLIAALRQFSSVTVKFDCAVVSVVGRNLRTALPRLGAAMSVLESCPVHLVSEASEDLNLSFVVDEDKSDSLVARLHEKLLEGNEVRLDPQFGPLFSSLKQTVPSAVVAVKAAT